MNRRAVAARFCAMVGERLTSDEPRALDAAYDFAAQLLFEIDVARAWERQRDSDVLAKVVRAQGRG